MKQQKEDRVKWLNKKKLNLNIPIVKTRGVKLKMMEAEAFSVSSNTHLVFYRQKSKRKCHNLIWSLSGCYLQTRKVNTKMETQPNGSVNDIRI